MLTESDLRILTALNSPTSITELSDITGYSVSYVSERVNHLQNIEMVTLTRSDRCKEIRALPTTVLETYKDLTTTHSHIDFPSLISPSMLQVCWFLDEPVTVTQIESHLKLHRRRIYQLLEKLQYRGLIKKENSEFVITDRMKGLVQFAKTVIDHKHKVETPTQRIVWSSPHEYLMIPMNEKPPNKKDYQPTGIQRFSDYDLDFFTTKPIYFYSEIREKLSLVDLISHSLIVEADTRNMSYCALLMIYKNISYEDLKKASNYYGIEETIDKLIKFVETRGKNRTENLPEWQEIKKLSEQYEVDL